ncbi:hypothetical protein [Chryseobacterium sp. SIMBA_029]|uniref:hypothetical protein n=1 Tax=Chryseobacterium sp. SIMBA_029 TaxID=3085772 RepID=UPI003978448A
MKNATILSKTKMKQINGSGEFPIWELNECLREAGMTDNPDATEIMTQICYDTYLG